MAWTMLASPAGASVTFTNTPSAISNTYNGIITLQIGGLTNSETVEVQKYLDLDGSNVVDASAFLVQQFRLTDGKASVFTNGTTSVTNFNVPGDTDGVANGSITANLYPCFDFEQEFVGTYLFVLSSPVGHFSPITNSLVFTNFPFPQKITGNVVSNSTATTLPYSVVVLIQSLGGNDSTPVAGVVANKSGAYTINMPAGTYSLIGFKTNYVTSFAAAPSVTLSANATVTTNVSLTLGTNFISGRLVDSTNSNLGLGGCSVTVQSADHTLFALGAADTNGNFTASVTPNQWKVGPDSHSCLWNGYYPTNQLQVNTTTGSVSGLIISVPKATAIFYGTVKDIFGNPLPGVAVYSEDNDNNYDEMDGFAFTNGQYVTPAIGGLSNDPWQVSEDYGGPANYIYSQSSLQQNGGTNLNVGQAVQQNFTGILATNQISGNVKYNGTNVIGVGVNANATINGVNYSVNNVDTDTNGNYSFNVANGDWSVNIDENSGDNDSLDSVLGNNNYLLSDNSNVNITNNNATANFNVIVATGQISGNVQESNGNPISGVAVYAFATIGGVQYDASSMDTDGNGDYSLNVANGNWTVGVNGSGGSDSLDNILGVGNYQYPNNQNVNINNNTGTANFTVQLCNGIQIITTSPLTDGQIGNYYSIQFQASSCNDNFTWSLNSGTLPPGLTLYPGGPLNGTPTTPGTYNFSVNVTDGNGDSTNQSYSLAIDGTLQPLQVTTPSDLNDGMVSNSYSQQLSASGGLQPYSWSLSPGSLALPAGLSMNTSGAITGTPSSAAIGTNYFEVRVTDAQPTNADMFLSIVVYPTALITNVSLPNGTNGLPYSVAFGVTGGAGDSSGWTLNSGSLPNGISIGQASISGTPTQTGTFSFTVGAIDNSGYSFQHAYSLTILPNILQITTASLSNATVGVAYTNQLQGSGGTTPYNWTIANGSQPLPSALTLTTNGLISGMPSAIGAKSFIVRLTDNTLPTAQTVTRSFTLNITPILDLPVWQTNRFQMRLTGFANQNYTLQLSTNLTSWTALFITNNAATNTFFLTDPNATNQHRFYRILIGP